jgi:hypothetical protein
MAGICKLDTYLGSFREGKERKTMIQDIVAKARGDVEIVSRVFRAMSAGVLDAAKISERANRVCYDFRNGMNGVAMEVQPPAEDFTSGLTVKLRYGKTYLGTLEYQFGSVDILVNVAELTQGELLALDIGVHMQRNDGAPLEAEGYTEDRILMIVPSSQRPRSCAGYIAQSWNYKQYFRPCFYWWL